MLYNQLLTRVYRNDRTGEQMFVLMAYGGKQTDQLQLHRPEICYPAFGFELLRNDPMDVAIGKGVDIPARRILAEGSERIESVVYWTRLGEFLPRSGGEQREDRLKIALQGIISDGLLSRFSTVAADPETAWKQIEAFIASLVGSVKPQYRKVLIGTERANLLAAAR
jgi:EpsI family protein